MSSNWDAQWSAPQVLACGPYVTAYLPVCSIILYTTNSQGTQFSAFPPIQVCQLSTHPMN